MSQPLIEFRQMKDEFFARDPHSPLTRPQKKLFQGLNYFPPAPDLRLELELEVFPEFEQLEMQTSTGDVQVYRRHGVVRFTVDGEPAQLTVFSNEK